MSDGFQGMVASAELAAALRRMKLAFGAGTSVPILRAVRLTGAGSSLRLSATDLDVLLTVTIGTIGAGSGTVVVPWEPLADAASRASLALSLTSNATQVSAKSGPFALHLDALPLADWPGRSAWEPTHRFTMPAATLRTALDGCVHAMGTADTRYYLLGVCLRRTPGELAFWATDGHRLARFIATVELPFMDDAVLPAGTVRLLIELLQDQRSGDVAIEVAPECSRAAFRTDAWELDTRLIECRYPETETVLPPASPRLLTIDRDELQSALDWLAAVPGRSKPVAIDGSEAGVQMSCRYVDGAATVSLPGASFTGPPGRVAFQHRYLVAAIHDLTGTLDFGFDREGVPARLTARSDSRVLRVIMPVRE